VEQIHEKRKAIVRSKYSEKQKHIAKEIEAQAHRPSTFFA
jgi:hypothetical protein